MSDAGAIISTLTAAPDRTAFLVDFDGSLSPIVERAADARPLPEVPQLLADLARVLGRVGIVSGRPVDFLVEHVPAPGVVYTGLYGMEHVVDGRRSVDARVVPYVDAVAAAVEELRTAFPGDEIEPKSGVSVTVHWRPFPERAPLLRAFAADVAARYGLALLDTRMAVELRPPVAIDKGAAARALVEGYDVAAFAGDDTGDLPAFAALADAARAGELRGAVRIGVLSPEAPPELRDAVDHVVDGPAGLVALLRRVRDEIV